MSEKAYAIYEFPIGRVKISYKDGAITGLDLTCDKGQGLVSDLSEKAMLQLSEYFEGKRKAFDLPLEPQGTAFQKKVWAALRDIPYGETRSYKDIAEKIGNPKACRAVGGANNKNPIFIVIPCHRVIGADGSLVGYGGGLDVKRYLLELESANY